MTATDALAPTPRRLEWQVAEVRKIVAETPRAKTLWMDVRSWPGHAAGQHVDIRLTAEDGYQAQRSYSIASPPDDSLLALTVARVDNGEVSPYLLDDVRPGDRFELRGPIGGYFVWTTSETGPMQLIAAGSGIAPLMAMLRHRARQNDRRPAVLLYSSRSWEDVIYRDDLDAIARRDPALRVVHTLTSVQPANWAGYRRRVDKAMLAESCFAPQMTPATFVCGPTPFVETTAGLLVELGYDPLRIKTERFGPTGG
jgi:ferredoxin-NADP reductase